VQDIDECVSMPGVCAHGRCRNTIGSFRCVCQPGFRYNDQRMICEGLNVFCLFLRSVFEFRRTRFSCMCKDLQLLTNQFVLYRSVLYVWCIMYLYCLISKDRICDQQAVAVFKSCFWPSGWKLESYNNNWSSSMIPYIYIYIYIFIHQNFW